MIADDAVADDVVFLVVAALRGRCMPARSHDLPRMAVLAHVPALVAGGGDGGASENFRHDVTVVVKDSVRQASCAGPVILHIGDYTRTLDPEAYAAAFPDSYFDPGISVAPEEFRHASLDQRVTDSCTSVAYAMLPLDSPRAWQCAGLRANARSTILRLCRTEGASPEQAASHIQQLISGLPATCQ
ncbi:hypothetical protein [Luteibacter sp. W1I16]|uniref:hypothetical protein n=1 Tax=Luteibacter sp. W1I16 TaxID=3373922 RepID=UPI003D1CCCB3